MTDINPRIADLAHQVAVWRQAIAASEESIKDMRAEHDKAEGALFDALENTGARSVKTDDGTFSLNDLAWAKVEDPAVAREWAEHNRPELITLNHQKLAVIVREALKGEEGAVMPPGVTYTTSRKINWRKSA